MATDEKVEYWATPLLTKRGTLAIAAPQKSMKTYFSLQLALSIANGKPFLGWPTEQAKVHYIDWEIGVPEAKKRLEKMQDTIGRSDNFKITFPEETTVSLDPTNPGGNQQLEELIQREQPDVLFIDTLKQATNAEENSATEMMKTLRNLKLLQDKYKFSAVLVHHKGKQLKDSAHRDGESLTMRGSSVIGDFVGTIGIVIKHQTPKDKPEKIDVHWTFRNHEPIDPFKLQFDRASGLFVRRSEPSSEPSETTEPRKKPRIPVKGEENIADGIVSDKNE